MQVLPRNLVAMCNKADKFLWAKITLKLKMEMRKSTPAVMTQMPRLRVTVKKSMGLNN